MNEVADFFLKFPVLGSIPMWGVFAAVLIALIKIWPQLKQQSIDERLSIRDRYLLRIKELVQEVKDCRADCEEQERRLQGQIDGLKTKINNEAWQRVQSEISLVHTLIQVVDAPQLKLILDALKARSVTLPHIIEGADGDGIERA